MTFERFVAVDWSGARGPNYGGIAVAECHAGDGAPRLIACPGSRHRWWRSDVLDWVLAAAGRGQATLFGFDFAFALPFCDQSAYLPGSDISAQAPADLWECVDDLCRDQPDLFAGTLTEVPQLREHFWRRGSRPLGFDERLRVTDQVCRDAHLGRPQSVFKLIGAAQVGKGSLAGMRFLLALRRAVGSMVSIWPFDFVDSSHHVCCEVYPGFFAAVGGGRGKIRDRTKLMDVLMRLGCSDGAVVSDIGNDHEIDALVSAVGLRYYAQQGTPWHPVHMTSEAAKREGWIFGLT